MISNFNQAPLFDGRNEHDEALTVQVSDATSHLGHLLLEADWDELTNYLDTDDGKRDVDASNDPIGLFKSDSAKRKHHGQIPSSKSTAFFAALFVRAPYDIIGKIYTMEPAQVDHPTDLMYVLTIIPSEEEMRKKELRTKVPYRARTWTSDEYYRILDLLLQAFIASPPSLSQPKENQLMQFWPDWMIGSCGKASHHELTPLAIAAYNPDVPASIVQNLCALQPHSMEKPCRFNGHPTIPLVVAAASPLPDPMDSLSNFEKARDLRWEKVTLLTLHKGWYHGWYDNQRGILKEAVDSGKHDIQHPMEVIPRPEPTISQIKDACDEALKYHEWELVREFLKRNSGKEELEKISVSLSDHDKKSEAQSENKEKSQQKAEDRSDWLHKNMGVVMYPIDAVVDLVQAVIPEGLKNHQDDGGIVGPMS